MELEVRDLVKSFGDHLVLDKVSFSVSSGTALGLLGRNGAGKTTTIRIIMQLFPADSGQILIDGKPIDMHTIKVGYLPEERGLYPKSKIIDQLVYLGCLKGMSSAAAKESAIYWLKRTEMSEYTNKKLMALSKGNQQKIQLVSTLLDSPDIIVLDEPFSGLDPVNAVLLKDIVKELIASGKIVIFSSHQMGYVEEFCQQIAIINNGSISVGGNLRDIKRTYSRDRLIVNGQELEKIKQFIEKGALPYVKSIDYYNNNEELIITMNSEDNKLPLMSILSKSGMDIDAIKVYEPSLNDIFVKYTGGTI